MLFEIQTRKISGFLLSFIVSFVRPRTSSNRSSSDKSMTWTSWTSLVVSSLISSSPLLDSSLISFSSLLVSALKSFSFFSRSAMNFSASAGIVRPATGVVAKASLISSKFSGISLITISKFSKSSNSEKISSSSNNFSNLCEISTGEEMSLFERSSS